MHITENLRTLRCPPDDLEVPAGENAAAFVEKKMQTLRRALLRQLAHYFSEENWAKDSWLQQQADGEGSRRVLALALS